jgi:hypothetical protein
LKHLSDASLLGKILVFPANVRLDWKMIASTNTLAYLASSTVTKEKCFIILAPGGPGWPIFPSLPGLPFTPGGPLGPAGPTFPIEIF